MSDSSRVSRAMANARRLSSEARFTDDAIRHVLGIDRVQRAALPAPKVSLPRVAFLEKPLPPWWNDPIFTQPLCRTRSKPKHDSAQKAAGSQPPTLSA